MTDAVLVAQVTASSPADAVQSGALQAASAVAQASEATASGGEGAASYPFPPFDTTNFPSQIIWFIVVFLALYFVMSRLAVPQIGGIIAKRRGRIDGDLKEAERLKGETEKAISSYEEALATARKNAHSIAEETRTSIRADLDAKRRSVEDELSQKVATAEARIQQTKDTALGRVGEIAAETAAAVVRQLSGESNAKDVADAVAQVMKG
jgi:F-type H+-transporting ATPase subunit b